ncbi:hypothetical protein AB0903_21205 [Streptomyces sp. NPDC048389]|uniref:hypothetical protein n=1 Tax=Streptomyces sp. NPDC048389 TaxID=3154622 RepID=UPI003455C08D
MAGTWNFRATHVVPQSGMYAWEAPDVSRPTTPLDPLLPVQLAERRGDWGRIVCANSWSAWVDGRLLVPVPQEPPAAGRPLARTEDPRPLLARIGDTLARYRRAVEDLADGLSDGETFRDRTRGLRVGLVVDGEAVWLYDAEHERWVYCDGLRLSTFATTSGPAARAEAAPDEEESAGPGRAPPPAGAPAAEPTRVVAPETASPPGGPEPTRVVGPEPPDGHEPTPVATPEPPNGHEPADGHEPTRVVTPERPEPPGGTPGHEPTRIVTPGTPPAAGDGDGDGDGTRLVESAPVREEERPDATRVVASPEASEVAEPSGTRDEDRPDATGVARRPDPARAPEGPDVGGATERADGTRAVEQPDAPQVVEPPDATRATEPADGTRVVEQPDATQVVQRPEGPVGGGGEH